VGGVPTIGACGGGGGGGGVKVSSVCHVCVGVWLVIMVLHEDGGNDC
jgi:hypothetical protein